MPATRRLHPCGHRGFGRECHRCPQATGLVQKIEDLKRKADAFKPVQSTLRLVTRIEQDIQHLREKHSRLSENTNMSDERKADMRDQIRDEIVSKQHELSTARSTLYGDAERTAEAERVNDEIETLQIRHANLKKSRTVTTLGSGWTPD